MTQNTKHRAYLVRVGHNQYQLHTWSERHNCYWQSPATDWWRARTALGEANCRNPKTCKIQSHYHVD